MGWFWSDTNPSAPRPSPAPPQPTAASPPPSCPMHKSDSKSSPFNRTSEPARPSACPVKDPTNHPLLNTPKQPQSTSTPPSQSQSQPSLLSKYNPLNLIPTGLTNTRSDSSIPRSDTNANWEYPSPQQMYNAMLRKGYTDTPIDAVESMVAVHNFLNEGAWAEIVEWESLFSQGLSAGWQNCARGEGFIAFHRAKREQMAERRLSLGLPEQSSTEVAAEPKLVRFQGRPKEPTPKARILSLLGMAFPATFGSEPPFDRHDWYVSRRGPDGTEKQVRYVIDYYGGGVQETGEPVFYLDIRPALDTPTAAAERAIRWSGDLWWRASGGVAREMDRVRQQQEDALARREAEG
ncbi:Cytochrome c heme lyase [Cyphellophora attinorum]|uniref:Holocytochrome c-type synthase n=1 Tax=Cyphellophora attinorum TaxID=1664694 RepID=A0A0N0NNC2_9EURO|nr:Cytochrome c heme lyase [Phialophora attinorum]KPI41358.1 Cytochrome c heme lyase [Phialophora attinorum]